MGALGVLTRGDPLQLQEPTRAVLELRQWVATTATPPAPAADIDLDTGDDDVQRKRKDTLDGLLSGFEFDSEETAPDTSTR